MTQRPHRHGFSMVELLVAVALIVILAAVAVPAGVSVMRTSSLAVSAGNIRQLAAGGAAYLGENNYRFWPFLQKDKDGDVWWFGLEPVSSKGKPEGEREIDMTKGPLANYMPRRMVPDPSLRTAGKPFKPKYRFGYIGAGYNAVIANGWVTGTSPKAKQPLRYWDLTNPASTVVFATSAQVYPFDKNYIEEFYGLDERQVTVHFRHNGQAMVSFADGSAGFIPMDPSTRDTSAPQANIGRFAPKGSFKYLK